MATIQWKDSYSVNNHEIDEQHQKWFSIFNEMQSALLYAPPIHADAAGREALMKMVDYTHDHFRHEMDYLRSIGYPEIDEHRRLHNDFDELIFRYNRNVSDGRELVLNSEVLAAIRKWLLVHILIEDKKFSDFAKGSSPPCSRSVL